ncbi:hypothetical protein [Kitasatospora sp. NPDC050543]|uniref:hypothetical protein n=1 Tax=Kitasatospora sp. NPDC050543 TaxID=3364054 RepID=UPI0037911217
MKKSFACAAAAGLAITAAGVVPAAAAGAPFDSSWTNWDEAQSEPELRRPGR